MLKWIKGRQAGDYEKLPLIVSKRFKFDLYLLRFPDGSSVPWHRDPAIEGYRHHRINLTLNSCCVGSGVFLVDGPYTKLGPLVKFRPDIYLHCLTKVEKIFSNQYLYMLSIGFLKKIK